MDKLKVFGLVLLVILIGYNLYTGATVQKVGVPGLFEIEFHRDAPPSSNGGAQASEPPASNPPNGGAQATEPPVSNPPQPVQPRSVSGNWTGSIGGLDMTVTKVEALRQIGSKDILRFYVTINNQTTDSITLPLFGYFVAVDNSGHSYKPDVRLSDWPNSFPPGMSLSGSIDLEDPVPQDATTFNLSFTTIFGSLDIGGKSISVTGISKP